MLLHEDPPGATTLCLHAHLTRLAPELGFVLDSSHGAADPELFRRYRRVLPTVFANGIPITSGVVAVDDLYRELVKALGPDPWHGVPREEPEFLPLLECPRCAGDLEGRPAGVCCLACGHLYERVEGVLLLSANPRVRASGGALDRLGRMLWFPLR